MEHRRMCYHPEVSDNTGRCQACRTRRIAHLWVPEQDGYDFALCEECSPRITSRSLRPLEWFNLAAIYGSLIHPLKEEFYDLDGRALKPQEPVVDAHLHPSPTLEEVRSNLDRLLDFTFAGGVLDKDVIDALSATDRGALLQAIEIRRAQARNSEIVRVTFEIAALVVGPSAADWVRRHWNESPEPGFVLASYIRAARFCLPRDEAFGRSIALFERLPEADRRSDVQTLGILEDERVTDWIEQQLSRADAIVTENWAEAVAWSGVTWNRIRNWMERGRPLSLLALDTLCFLGQFAARYTSAPRLRDPGTQEAMAQAVEELARKDPAPRVQQRAMKLRDRWINLRPR